MVFTRRHALWITFAVLVLWIFATRWTLQYEPLERDITTYAVAGREILTGRVLYSDLWDHKPPGIHLIFAGATALVGPGVPAVLLVNVALPILVDGFEDGATTGWSQHPTGNQVRTASPPIR
jgi:hypothetical protein